MNSKSKNISTTTIKNPGLIMLILLSFVPLSGMTIDLFSPSLPAMSSALGIPNGIVKLVISIYLLSYALGNFVVGMITDALGRKTLIRISGILFVISSLMPILFPNEYVLLAARAGQGFFMGSLAVISRSIYSDILPPEKLIKLGPTMGLLWGLGPIAGPILGGYLQHYFDWRSGFYFFSIVTFILLILIFIYIPETISKKSELSVKRMKADLFEVISDKEFMSLTAAMGVAYALIITFNTLGPFLIQDIMGYSPVFFGKLAIFLGLAFLPAPIISRKLLNILPINKLFFIVIHSFVLVTILLLILSFFFDMSLVILILATIVIYFTCGSIFPVSMGKGMSMFRHVAGAAAAVMYLLNIFITSLVAFTESFVHTNSIFGITLIYFSLMTILLILYWYKLKDL